MHRPVTSYDFPDRLRASLVDQNHPAHEGARRLILRHDRQGADVNPSYATTDREQPPFVQAALTLPMGV